MNSFLILILILSLSTALKSQEIIKTVRVYNKQVDFNFTGEWQYISTDLYLFNENRFNKMINDLYVPKSKRLKKKAEVVENVLITTTLDGLKNYENIEYPIYNFRVTRDESGKYNTQASSSEVIRIIDNFPISSINNYIGAKVKVDVITSKNKSYLYKLVASQLQNISDLSNPTDAAMQLVGEFGKMMERDAAGKEYHFESTIRLYEEQDFNKRFHSLSIFVFAPSTIYSPSFDTLAISEFITNASNPTISRAVLKKNIRNSSYPFMVTVNYKSKYIPEIPDVVDFETLKIRKAKCENNYQSGLINREIYNQEKLLIEFFEIFAQLKLDVNNYELDYKNKISEDYSRHSFIIMQDLLHLKNFHREILISYTNNPVFENKFRQIYDDFIGKAEIFLEANNKLRDIKYLVNTFMSLEYNTNLTLDSLNREEYLRSLYSVNLPQREKNSNEVKSMNFWISQLENNHFDKIYSPKIDALLSLEINPESYKLALELENSMRNTNCVLCRERVITIIEEFKKSYADYEKQMAFNQLEDLKTATKGTLYEISKKETYISKNLEQNYFDEMPAHIDLIAQDFTALLKDKEELQDLLKKDYYYSELEEIESTFEMIKLISTKLVNGFETICKQEPDLCN